LGRYVKKTLSSFETIFRKLPVVGALYSSIHDVLDLFEGGIKEKLGRSVLVDIPQADMKTLGFLMRENTVGLPRGVLTVKG
jgi:uncharacterized membrane protein